MIAKDAGDRLFIDIASIREKNENFGNNYVQSTTKPYWQIIVDEKTQIKFSYFFSRKSNMIEPTCEQLSKWRAVGKILVILDATMKAKIQLLKFGCIVLIGNSGLSLNILVELLRSATIWQNLLFYYC